MTYKEYIFRALASEWDKMDKEGIPEDIGTLTAFSEIGELDFLSKDGVKITRERKKYGWGNQATTTHLVENAIVINWSNGSDYNTRILVR